MYHIKKAELYEEESLPNLNKEFVVDKCGSPDRSTTRVIIRDTRTSTLMGVRPTSISRSKPQIKNEKNGYVSRIDFFLMLKRIYDGSGIAQVNEILLRYGKPHMMKDFLKWLVSRGV